MLTRIFMYKKIITHITNLNSTLLLVGAIIFGIVLGGTSPDLGNSLGSYVDPTILVLVSLLFFEVRFEALSRARKHLRFLSIAWVTNFIIVPTIGFGIASLFLSGQPLFFTGLLIYFIAPCTDWFLGFTKLAGGNTALGTILLPINMLSQLALYPIYLSLFAQKTVNVDISSATTTMIDWFLVPFIGALGIHIALRYALPGRYFDQLLTLVNAAIPFVIAVLVALIFAANIATIFAHLGTFALILIAVFSFFAVMYVVGERVSRFFRFSYPEHALFTMTTAARNAPLMLGVTAAALPNQPLMYAAIIIGMLVEFPHLTILKHVLLKQKKARP